MHRAIRLPVVCVLLLFGGSALAASECQLNFNTQGSEESGRFFGSVEKIDGVDVEGTLGQLQEISSQYGFQPQQPTLTPLEGKLVIVQEPTTNARGFAMLVLAKWGPGSTIVTIAAKLPPGMQTESSGMRDVMCGMLAKVTPGYGHLMGSDMLRAVAHAPVAVDNRDPRTAPPAVADPTETFRPLAAFDPVSAKVALEPGTATITGAVCAVYNGHNGLVRQANQEVALYPATPYVVEAYDLLNKAVGDQEWRHKQVRLEVDPSAANVRLSGKTNANGQFQFSRLKAGTYLLVSIPGSATASATQVYTGSGYDTWGQTDYYAPVGDISSYRYLVVKQIEVKDGETVHQSLFGSTGPLDGALLRPLCR